MSKREKVNINREREEEYLFVRSLDCIWIADIAHRKPTAYKGGNPVLG